MDDREAVAKICYDWLGQTNVPPGEARWIMTDQIISLLRSRGWTNDPLAVPLVEQARKLRKPCLKCEGNGKIGMLIICRDPGGISQEGGIICPQCHGTGALPVEVGDVAVRVREG